jgi:hypothetical protein
MRTISTSTEVNSPPLARGWCSTRAQSSSSTSDSRPGRCAGTTAEGAYNTTERALGLALCMQADLSNRCYTRSRGGGAPSLQKPHVTQSILKEARPPREACQRSTGDHKVSSNPIMNQHHYPVKLTKHATTRLQRRRAERRKPTFCKSQVNIYIYYVVYLGYLGRDGPCHGLARRCGRSFFRQTRR